MLRLELSTIFTFIELPEPSDLLTASFLSEENTVEFLLGIQRYRSSLPMSYFMRCHSRLTIILTFLIPLLSCEAWLECANVFGKSGKSDIVSSRHGKHTIQSGPRLPTTRGVTSQSKMTQRPAPRVQMPRQKLTLKRRRFQSPQFHRPIPFFFPSIIPEHSNSMTTVVPEDSPPPQPVIKEKPNPAEVSHPLVIELRCGKYVRIPWPESGILYSEERQEERCGSP